MTGAALVNAENRIRELEADLAALLERMDTVIQRMARAVAADHADIRRDDVRRWMRHLSPDTDTEAQGFHIEGLRERHQNFAPVCPSCLFGLPLPCECGGVVHGEDEILRCDRCGENARPTKPTPSDEGTTHGLCDGCARDKPVDELVDGLCLFCRATIADAEKQSPPATDTVIELDGGVMVVHDEYGYGRLQDETGNNGEVVIGFYAENIARALLSRDETIDTLVEALRDARVTLRHAQLFIGTRERMHPDGQELYQQCRDNIDAALTKAGVVADP